MAAEAPRRRRSPARKNGGIRTSTPHNPPGPHAIARRAYEIFLARGAEHGHDLDDWLQAEREVGGLPKRSDS
jgi:hypothetical protein